MKFFFKLRKLIKFLTNLFKNHKTLYQDFQSHVNILNFRYAKYKIFSIAHQNFQIQVPGYSVICI